MSNIYIQEPPTKGKVLLKTTVGDIDVELWSKEAPKACRNFTQLCMEGYYNGTVFHRVIPNFIVQGGDPTGTGTGGESVYGKPFKDEFHSRLRFVRRGLVCMANAGPHDNGSQFFFTMGATPELNNKHTIFGKVTGNTVYNMLKLAECDIGDDDRPLYPHKVLRTAVMDNPFDDIVPRVLKDSKDKAAKKAKKEATSKATKNFKLLSFGEEAEEDEEEVTKATEVMKTKGKSSHDLLKDKQLSSKPALDVEYSTKRPHLEVQEDSEEEEEDSEAIKEAIRKKLKKQHDTDSGPPDKAAVKLDKKESSVKAEVENPKAEAQESHKQSQDRSKDNKRSKSHSREKDQPDAKSHVDDKRTETKSDSSSSHKERHKRDVEKGAQSDSTRLASKGSSPHHKHSPNHKGSPNRRSREKDDRPEREDRKDKSRKKDKPYSKDKEAEQEAEQDSNKIEELQKEARELRKELAKMKQKEKEKTQQPAEETDKEPTAENAGEEPPTEQDPDPVSSFKAERKKYKEVRAKQAKKGSAREEATLAILAKFKSHLNTAQEMFGETEEGEVLDEEEDADKQDPSTYRWLSHKLKFDDSEQAQKVKDANIEELDRYEIFDPRNPINKRRREQSKAIMKNKC